MNYGRISWTVFSICSVASRPHKHELASYTARQTNGRHSSVPGPCWAEDCIGESAARCGACQRTRALSRTYVSCCGSRCLVRGRAPGGESLAPRLTHLGNRDCALTGRGWLGTRTDMPQANRWSRTVAHEMSLRSKARLESRSSPEMCLLKNDGRTTGMFPPVWYSLSPGSKFHWQWGNFGSP